MPPASAAPAPDLRARRRRQTLLEVHVIAVRLIDERGFDATTVDDIAEAAGISQRTFFRYFPAKEHAVLLPHREFEELIEEYAPPGSAPALDSLDALYERRITHFLGTASDTFPAIQRIIRSEPKVRDAMLATECAMSDRLAERFRAAYPDADALTIRLILEVSSGVFRAACEMWRREDHARRPDLLGSYREARHGLRRLLPSPR